MPSLHEHTLTHGRFPLDRHTGLRARPTHISLAAPSSPLVLTLTQPRHLWGSTA